MARHWHSCARWKRFGMACPFKGEKEHDREDPDFKEPKVREPARPKPKVLAAPAKAEAKVDVGKAMVLAEAEEIVTRAAEAIPLRGRSLAQTLRDRGPLAVGVGAAAGVAIRAVAKGFAGGGFNFPSIFDPKVGQRVR